MTISLPVMEVITSRTVRQLSRHESGSRAISMLIIDDGITFVSRDVTPLRFQSEVGDPALFHFSSFYNLSSVEDVEARIIAARDINISPHGGTVGPFPLPQQTMAYDPLPGPNWTRLFRLSRIDFKPIAPNGFDVTVHGEMRSFELDSMPPYRALSYTWAKPYTPPFEDQPPLPPTIETFLECNGSILHITDNLFAALCQLGPNHYAGWIWIDAICINQLDEQEKGYQIQMMGAIYSKSSNVIGWLGGVHNLISSVVWATTEFLSRYQQLQSEDLPLTQASLSEQQMNEHFGVDNISLTLTEVYAFYTSCRWFSRAWVTQEVVLAQKLTLLLGGLPISWAALKIFTKVMIETKWRDQIVSDVVQVFGSPAESWLGAIVTWTELPRRISAHLHNTEAWVLDNTLHGLEMFSHPPRSTGRKLMCLHELLFWTKQFDCSVAVDRFWSTISLAGSEFKADILHLTGANYQMTTHELFPKVAAATLSTARYLDILVHGGGPIEVQNTKESANLGYPSWVPNYTSENDYELFLSRSPARLNAGLCSQGTQAQRFYVDGATLRCCGNLFDEIVEAWDNRPDGYNLELLRMCNTFSPLIHGRPRFEVLWRTMITDETHKGETPAPGEYAASFWNYIVNLDGQNLSRKQRSGESVEDYFRLCDQYLRGLDTTSASSSGMSVTSADVRRFVEAHAMPLVGNGLGLHADVAAIGRGALPFIESRNRASSRAMLFRTKGGLMGICGGPCQPGDEVWAIRDAHVPFVMRSRKDRESRSCMPCRSRARKSFHLVGPCFVLDFMQGEMVKVPAFEIAIV